MTSQTRLLDLGRRSYAETWALQRALHQDVAAGREPDTWIVVEHDPVITIGRQGKTASLLVPSEVLAAKGVELHRVERGGDVTYHGPGQVVVYPIARLPRFREVVPLVRALEEAVLGACARYGIAGERWKEHAGVWVGSNCICAIGLAVKNMTSMHGIALNASIELDYDRLINPCGLHDRGITSLSRETGRLVSYDEAKDALLDEIEKVFRIEFVRDDRSLEAATLPFDSARFTRSAQGDKPVMVSGGARRAPESNHRDAVQGSRKAS